MTIKEIKKLKHVNVTEQDGMTTIKTDDGYYLQCEELREKTEESAETTESTEANTETEQVKQYAAVIYTRNAATQTFPDYTVVTEAEKQRDESGQTSATPLTLEEAKEQKTAEITAYDDSTAVNSFTINGESYWFKPDMRKTIQQGVEACKTAGRATYDATYGSISVSIPVDTALQLLAQLECYALDCQNVTAQHKAAVAALTTIEDVMAYDYTTGYPDKLNINI